MMKSIEAVRSEKGITKAACARHLGISRPTYDDYEAHPSKMRVEDAKRLCAFLGIDISDIFFLSNGN